MFYYIAEYDKIFHVLRSKAYLMKMCPCFQRQRETRLQKSSKYLRKFSGFPASSRQIVSLSCPVLHLSGELYEMLCVIAVDMPVSSKGFFDITDDGSELVLDDEEDASTVAKIPSTAEHCPPCDEVRAMRF